MSVVSRKTLLKMTASFPSTFEQQVAHYRLLLENQVERSTPAREINAYIADALKPVHVGDIVLTPFAPFRARYAALKTITPGQAIALVLLVLGIVAGIYYGGIIFAIVSLTLVMLFYLVDMIFYVFLALRGLYASTGEQIDDELVRALKGAKWPSYTVLCPLYREAAVAPQIVRAMQDLDYPAERLQIMILVQDDDPETLKALQSEQLPANFQVIVLPKGYPRTKPRACNYGLLHATGEYVVIFDAEDVPDVLQLKKAILTFLNHGPEVVCVQAKLSIYNPDQNVMTRWFTIGGSYWFDMALPGLQSIGLPIPLGGTSNHFRLAALREVGAWDAFNVTEDCDLGLRLAHYGYKTVVLDSMTYEEANSHVLNWLNQRSRWIKGYILTYLVNMRSPWRYMHPRLWPQFFVLQFMIGAKSVMLLINPLVWAMFWTYVFFRPLVEQFYHMLIPTPVLYIGTLSLVLGNFLNIYSNILSCLRLQRYSLIKWVFTLPVYWFLMSIAAYIAFFDLLFRPHYWSKTRHGLHLQQDEEEVADERSILASKSTELLAPLSLFLDNKEVYGHTPTVPLDELQEEHSALEDKPTQLLASLTPSLGDEEVDGNTATMPLPAVKKDSPELTNRQVQSPVPLTAFLDGKEVDGNAPTAPLHAVKKEHFLDILTRAKTMLLPASSPNDRALPEHIASVFKYVNDEIALRTQHDAKRVRTSSPQRDYVLWLLVLVSSVTGLWAVYYYFSQHQILNYLDTYSHLLIARHVVDSATPGLGQLGGVWLPLPHLLMLPFTLNDYLWHSGLAGACVSFPCYVLACVYVYLSTRRVTKNRAISFFSTLLFVLNPNVLYLQTTPLTEILLIALTTMACYHFFVWAQEGNLLHLILAALGTFLATLARYDGWFLFFCMLGGLVLICLLKKQRRAQLEGQVLAFGTLGGLGIVLWVLWNAAIFGDPLYFQNGPVSSYAQQQVFLNAHRLFTYHDIWLSVQTFVIDAIHNAGLVTFIVGIVGVAAFLIRRSFSPQTIAGLVFLFPFAFYIVSLFTGQAALYVPETIPASAPDYLRSVYGLYNARYGVQVVAPLAFFAAVLADRISVSRSLDTIHNWILRVITIFSSLIRRYSGQIVLVGCIVGQVFLNMSTGVISLQDSLYGIDCQPPHPIATYLVKHYDRGFLLANRFSSSTIDLGMDFKNVVYEGSGALWVQARKHPASTVNWVVINPNDTSDTLNADINVDDPNFLRNFENVSQESTGLTLYHHKNLAPLPTRAEKPDLTNSHPSCPVADARKVAYDISLGRRVVPPPPPPPTGPVQPPIDHPGFQTGMAIPLWSADAYGDTDTTWSSGLQSVRSQAGAKWIEMPLLFSQATYASTKVIIGSNTPSLDSFEKGVRKAHAHGYRVFVVPLVTVQENAHSHWAGAIDYSTDEQYQLWFNSYWRVFQPYVEVAQRTGVEQLAIGTEEEKLQQHAPDSLWNELIERVHAVFSGPLTYDMNWWNTPNLEPQPWMKNPLLETVGISAYFPLTNVAEHLNPASLVTLWKVKIKAVLDAFAVKLGKPILISEIGYRNSPDALYNVFDSAKPAQTDPEEQAAACNAVLANVATDPNISGVFFWGWGGNVGSLNLSGLPALSVIHSYFSAISS